MAGSGGRNTVGGRCLLYLFTCHLFSHYFCHSPSTHCNRFSSYSAGCCFLFLFPDCPHIFCLVAMLLPSSPFLFISVFLVFLPSCSSVSVLISLTDFAAPAVSAFFPLSVCLTDFSLPSSLVILNSLLSLAPRTLF